MKIAILIRNVAISYPAILHSAMQYYASLKNAVTLVLAQITLARSHLPTLNTSLIAQAKTRPVFATAILLIRMKKLLMRIYIKS